MLKADEIFHSLNIDAGTDELNLLEGLAGHILFRYVYGLEKDITESEVIEALLYKLSQNSPNLNINPYSLANGMSGNCWLFQYLHIKGYIELENGFFGEIDEILAQEAYNNLIHKKYDFLHGAAGIMFTLLKRPEENCKALEQLTRALLDIRIEYNGYKVWEFESPRHLRTGLTINMGLAHGIPSVMVLLSKLYAANILPEQCKAAIADCYNFIARQRNPKITPNDFSIYPIFVIDGTPNKYTARLAWCYGDLGIGVAYYTIGKNLNDDTLIREAIEIFRYYATFTNEPKLCVRDSSLCHGAAGVMHLFHRMYFNTGIEQFKHTAEYWLSVLLNMDTHKDGIAGYKVMRDDWEADTSLLEGVAGVGLVLSSYRLQKEPDWDECLFMS